MSDGLLELSDDQAFVLIVAAELKRANSKWPTYDALVGALEDQMPADRVAPAYRILRILGLIPVQVTDDPN